MHCAPMQQEWPADARDVESPVGFTQRCRRLSRYRRLEPSPLPPRKSTRAVARRMFAPPAFAPIAPRRARKPNDAAKTIGTSARAGDTTTMSKGMPEF